MVTSEVSWNEKNTSMLQKLSRYPIFGLTIWVLVQQGGTNKSSIESETGGVNYNEQIITWIQIVFHLDFLAAFAWFDENTSGTLH